MKILTYNVHGLPWISCPIRSILLWALSKTSADVICFQEVFGYTVIKDLCKYADLQGFHVYFPKKVDCFAIRYLGFGNPSGLCILVKKGVRVLSTLQKDFETSEGLDALASKGVFGVCLWLENQVVWVLNTHFQSDFTEVPCFTFCYEPVRKKQERELVDFAEAMCKKGEVLIAGDFNQDQFHWLDVWDIEKQMTFPQTGQHLDHILALKHKRSSLICSAVETFPDLELSDHIPVLYEFVMRSSRSTKESQPSLAIDSMTRRVA